MPGYSVHAVGGCLNEGDRVVLLTIARNRARKSAQIGVCRGANVTSITEAAKLRSKMPQYHVDLNEEISQSSSTSPAKQVR